MNAKIVPGSISSVCEPEQVIYGNIIKKDPTNQTSENTGRKSHCLKNSLIFLS